MKYFSKKHSSQILIGFSVFIMLTAFGALKVNAQVTNYCGTWKLNEASTDFGNLTKNSADLQLKIVQGLHSITIERFYVDETGQKGSYLETLNFDGKPVNVAIDSIIQKKVYISLSADNKALIESAEYFNSKDNEQSSRKSSLVWTLSPDGKMLSCSLHLQKGNELYRAKYVYDKVE